MARFTLEIDDDILDAISEDVRRLIPRRSRRSQIEAILYEAYKDQIERRRAERGHAAPILTPPICNTCDHVQTAECS
jgi:hypothetical protein